MGMSIQDPHDLFPGLSPRRVGPLLSVERRENGFEAYVSGPNDRVSREGSAQGPSSNG